MASVVTPLRKIHETAIIEKGAKVYDAIIGVDTLVGKDMVINEDKKDIVLFVNGKAAKK